METVAEENPLRSATSRMVTALPRRRGVSAERRVLAGDEGLESAMPLEFRALAGGHYSTMHWVSRIAAVVLAVLCGFSLTTHAQGAASAKPGAIPSAKDPQKLFEAGESALRSGKLDEAEGAFQQVLAVDPASGAAYANLGVIHMRRKQWQQALNDLHKAEHLLPKVAGIRLNIGLVYFRQSDFGSAIKPFESVVRDLPDSFQARYLLGLCYFFNDRWQDTVTTMEPLWTQASDQLNYLYVLGIAASKAKNPPLEEKALGRLAEIGQDTPELHLLMGKAHLNRDEYDDAVRELELAAKADPRLPFVHFNLGLVYVHQQNYDRAREEFQKDLKIEPDVALNWEQLGGLEFTVGNEDEAAKDYRQALKLDPHLVNSHMGLAKIEEHKRQYAAALAELESVLRLQPGNSNARYLRGQVLVRLGREKEGRDELARATRELNQKRAARQKQLEGDSVPSPEVAREPQ
jgi:tetratricopeptide (TPR) repeat protein